MVTIAERYVRLVLGIGQHDGDYVDAYYGPEAWRSAAETGKAALDDLHAEACAILAELAGPSDASATEIDRLRLGYLRKQTLSARARIEILSGKKLSFDEESQALYDAVAPTFSRVHFEALLKELDRRLDGKGSVSARLETFKKPFIIPKDKLDAVFQAAIRECRERTLRRFPLPSGENFSIEYVTDKPWSGYNWYKGGGYSLIQMNTDLPIYIDRAIDLACHEGYPGHHVYNALMEQNLVRAKGWPEYAVYALFSPQSLIAEGTANFGIEVTFPMNERMEFEKQTLFPLAGMPPDRAGDYYEIHALTARLAYAGNEAARDYLDGRMTKKDAVDWLVEYGLFAPERAEQRIRFFEKYRSYVINYNLGQDMVRGWVENQGGTVDQTEKRWRLFHHLISTPQTPSNLLAG